MSGVLNLIWGVREAKYFCSWDWTGFRVRGLICPLGSHIAVRQCTVSPQRHCLGATRRSNPLFSFLGKMDCFAGLVIGRRFCADPAARNDVEIVGQIMRRTALRTGSAALQHRHGAEPTSRHDVCDLIGSQRRIARKQDTRKKVAHFPAASRRTPPFAAH
jgi:hypothetical protein